MFKSQKVKVRVGSMAGVDLISQPDEHNVRVLNEKHSVFAEGKGVCKMSVDQIKGATCDYICCFLKKKKVLKMGIIKGFI